MKKCPKCGYSKDEKEPFDKMMDRVLKESAARMKKESGYGVPDKLGIFNLNRNRRKEWQPEKRQKK